jgi:peptidoglycan/LPS O-acetylase OafA/YrhL
MGSLPRTGALDGLRGLAALAVVAFHVWLYRPERVAGTRTGLGDHVFFELHLGLICFFVLSGFLLYRGLLRRRDLKRYAVRRIARIVPAYYVSIAGCLVVFAVLGLDDLLPPTRSLPLFLAFGQNYFADTLMEINPVTWTLCVEAAFYVALPVVALVRSNRARVMLLLSLIGATIVWNALTYGGAWTDVSEKTLPAYAGHFALGMLVALWVESRRGRLPAGRTAALAAAGALVVVASGWWYETPGLMPDARALVLKLPAAVGFALLVAAAAAGRGAVVRVLSARPLAWAGVVSYGVYLWHLPLIIVGNELALLPEGVPLRLAVVTPAVLAAGWASWTLVERPAIRVTSGSAARGRGARSSAGSQRPTTATS